MEIEIKIPIPDDGVGALIERMRNVWNIVFSVPEFQRDVYFMAPGSRDRPQKVGSYIVRVRYACGGSLINMKQLTDTDGVWMETETSVGDGRVAEQIIATVGAEYAVTVVKMRRE